MFYSKIKFIHLHVCLLRRSYNVKEGQSFQSRSPPSSLPQEGVSCFWSTVNQRWGRLAPADNLQDRCHSLKVTPTLTTQQPLPRLEGFTLRTDWSAGWGWWLVYALKTRLAFQEIVGVVSLREEWLSLWWWFYLEEKREEEVFPIHTEIYLQILDGFPLNSEIHVPQRMHSTGFCAPWLSTSGYILC